MKKAILILKIIGFLTVICSPLIIVYAIIGKDYKTVFRDLFPESETPVAINYNFPVSAGTDEILTNEIKTVQKVVEPRSNPAIELLIKKAAIDGPIIYGLEGEELLKLGFWLYPGSVYPGENGISIIFGHRRLHLPPLQNTFYNLDKVMLNDTIEILLQDQTWLEYKVSDVHIIDPAELPDLVNAESDESVVKLVTCTPLGTSKQRLVISAKRVL